MLFITNLLLVLLSACALAAPPIDPARNETTTFNDIFRTLGAAQAKAAKKAALIAAETASIEKPANETAEVKRPTTTCTYQVNYKMNTYYLFGDNWNVTKDTLKKSCEKGRSRVLNHWSYREWQDQNGAHFCAKFNLPLASEEALEDRLDQVIATDGWDPEINCENHQENGFIPGHAKC